MKKRIWILTVFPQYFEAFFSNGVIGKLLQNDFEVHVVSLRDFTTTKYKGIDDTPYGGGPGMIMRADVLERALMEGVLSKNQLTREDLWVVYPSPKAPVWNAKAAREFALKFEKKGIVFLAGRYEGVDQRFVDQYVDQTICIGDFILSGGEIAIMAILDSSLRFFSHALGNEASAESESFECNLLEEDHYTKPVEFNGQKVPEVLMSGHHKEIENFKIQSRMKNTQKFRPDLLERKEIK